MNTLFKYLCLVLMAFAPLCAMAQSLPPAVTLVDSGRQVRPVVSSLEVQWGASAMRDTYLAPLRYDGWLVGLSYRRWRAWRWPEWNSRQVFGGRFGIGTDKGEHGDTWVGRLSYDYAAHRQWRPAERLTLMAGPSLGAEVGFDYNLKVASGNNPATARLVAAAGLSTAVVWRYDCRRKPCDVMLEAQVPLLGYALQPEYGASYYETFYLGNTRNLHHFTSLHNRQDLHLRLTTQLPVAVVPWLDNRKGALRVGAEWHIDTMRLNHVNTRLSYFSLVVGWTWSSVFL